MWQGHIPGLFCLRCRRGSALWCSADVADFLDVGAEDCDGAGNVITQEEVHVNTVPDFPALVAHDKLPNLHGCVETACWSVALVTEVSE